MNSELDHIQLSTLLIGELYKDNLLLSPDASPAPQRPAEPVAKTEPVQPPPQRPAEPVAKTEPVQPAPPKHAPESAPPKRMPEPVQQPVTQTPREPQPIAPVAPPPAAQTPVVPQSAPPIPDAPAAYKFLGKNGKKITILVQSPSIPFLPDNQLSFLTKILEACRMNIGDVAIVNTATAPVNIATLRQQLEPSVVLLFGIEPTAIKLPINFPVFKVQPYDNCSYLSAPPLNQLVQQSEESKLLKSKLWVCLKSLFNV